ncbi:MAG: DUF4203 domain-containing protein [Chloroflexi bacterium]|jgi:hypothetical protein|nr:DUF4203 domain-containing protein [Chloroflexota bacterium]
MGFELFCATLIALFLGAVILFGGYRLFLILLPIWGFFFGFGLGAHTVTLLFGQEFFATVTSWVVGFVVGVLFALLAYFFYAIAIAIVAGSLGYAIGVGFMNLIGFDGGFLVWLVGIALAIVVIVITFRFNLQKYVIIFATSVGGTLVIVGTFMFGLTGLTVAKLAENPVQHALSDSPFWFIFAIILVIAGVVVQLRANRAWEIEPYENRI